MGYGFAEGGIYRMPTHFGPTPGPRQRPDGSRWERADTPAATSVWVRFLTRPEQLRGHLPPGFELGEQAGVTVEARYLRDVEWLGGRSYNILSVSFDAVCVGATETVRGRLQAVVWEDSPDAIVSGREELGIPKLYAEIPAATVSEADGTRSVRGSAGWGDHTFVEIEASGLVEAPAAEPAEVLPNLQYKYVPRTGEWGEADVAYPVMTPAEVPNRRTLLDLRGEGRVSFLPAEWSRLPTLCHIVDALAALEVVSYQGAGMSETIGGKDLRDQRIIR